MATLAPRSTPRARRWDTDYSAKLATPDDAVRQVRSAHRVYVHPGCVAPIPLLDALCRRAEELLDVDIVHLLFFGHAPRTLNVRQRARALIELAHPDFREELARAAYQRHLM